MGWCSKLCVGAHTVSYVQSKVLSTLSYIQSDDPVLRTVQSIAEIHQSHNPLESVSIDTAYINDKVDSSLGIASD